MSNKTLSLSLVLEEFGKLFYLIHPGRNSFPSVEAVPDYVRQLMPYMLTLILLEVDLDGLGTKIKQLFPHQALVNIWAGKRHNIADRWVTVTSLDWLQYKLALSQCDEHLLRSPHDVCWPADQGLHVGPLCLHPPALPPC